ncbi:MAG: thioredoxin family protein [Parabacteroides sp.]|nr:thioredoxin family protein [Parabacteroides sp.]
MEIKVLGTGCSRCKTLLSTVELVVSEINLDATITKVDDILKIIEYNVMGLPALVVDEKVLSTGKTLSKEEVKKLLTL